MIPCTGNVCSRRVGDEEKEQVQNPAVYSIGEESPKGKTTPMATAEELEKLLAKTTLRDEPLAQEVERSTMLLRAYLINNEPQFVQVMELGHRVGHSINNFESHSRHKF